MAVKRLVRVLFVFAGLVLAQGRAAAQHKASDLAKQSQNPISSLISMPFQFNFYSGDGIPFGNTLINIIFQPVFPLHLTPRWLLVARPIVPWFDIPIGDFVRETGLGDIEQEFFFTPVKKGKVKFTWGAGPILSLPTASTPLLRTGAWAAGPAVVLVAMPRNLVLGILANNLWTFAENEDDGDIRHLTTDRDVNLLTLEPFINVNFPNGWSIGTAPIITANWDATSGNAGIGNNGPDDDDNDNRWTVPLGIALSKVNLIGRRPVSLQLAYYHNVVRPTTVGANLLRFQFTLLFPIERPAQPAADKDK